MFSNLKNHYVGRAQNRINCRIETIDKERKVLKESENNMYAGLKPLRNTHLYKNKPSLIENIKSASIDKVMRLLTVTIAEALVENVKLKPNLITTSPVKDEEIKMKKNNLEFLSPQEVIWGCEDEVMSKEGKFYFLLNLFVDLADDEKYAPIIRSILIDYVPFATYEALEKSVNEDTHFGSVFAPDYKNSNIDVFAESIYFFCLNNESDKIMKRFTDFLYGQYEYESKDEKGRYLKKSEIVNFQNFDKAFQEKLDDVLSPIYAMETYSSLGKRAYDIIIDDFKINSELQYYDMITSPESYDHSTLTWNEKKLNDVFYYLYSTSEKYIEQLKQIQNDLYGNIEKEYFDSQMFQQNSSPYYSEERFFQLMEQEEEKRLLQLMKEMEEQQVAEEIEEKRFIKLIEEQMEIESLIEQEEE